MFQFSLRTLLFGMFLTAVLAAAYRSLGFHSLTLASMCGLVCVAILPGMTRFSRALAIAGAIVLFFIARDGLATNAANSRRSSFNAEKVCTNNQRRIAEALLRYAGDGGSLPAAYSADKAGRRLHSWRTAILPKLGPSQAHHKLVRELPWDHEINLGLHRPNWEMICPKHRVAIQIMPTSYVAIVGPGFAFRDSTPVPLSEFTDGRSETILFLEAVNASIVWMEPRDLSWEEMSEAKQPLMGMSAHAAGVLTTFADGKQQWLPSTISAAHLQTLLTTAGGEDMSWMRLPKGFW